MVKIYSNLKVKYSTRFCDDYSKKDNNVKQRVIKQIAKITQNPKIGIPMRNIRKGTREVRIKPFRLSYAFNEDENLIIFLRIYHKDEQ